MARGASDRLFSVQDAAAAGRGGEPRRDGGPGSSPGFTKGADQKLTK
jgi:hypothetical protein